MHVLQFFSMMMFSHQSYSLIDGPSRKHCSVCFQISWDGNSPSSTHPRFSIDCSNCCDALQLVQIAASQFRFIQTDNSTCDSNLTLIRQTNTPQKENRWNRRLPIVERSWVVVERIRCNLHTNFWKGIRTM